MFNKKKKERILNVRISLKDDDEPVEVEVTDILLTNGFVVLFYLNGNRDYINNDVISCIHTSEKIICNPHEPTNKESRGK